MTRKHNFVDTYVCKSKGYEKLKDCNCANCEMEAKRKVLKKSSLNFFVLCETVVAANLNPQSKPTKQTLIFGTIVVASKKVDNSKIGVIISEYEKKYEKISGNIWVCPLNSLVHVKPDIIPYILPVPSQSRVNILRDKDLCLHLQALEPGDEVYVLPSHEVNGGNPSKAMILYKGVSSDLGEGIFFDVSVDKNEVHQSNGTLRSNPESYLSPERVIKVASDRIRITPTPMPCNGAPIRVSATPATCNGARSVNQLRKKFESMSSTSQTRYTEKLLPTPPPVYDRVGKLIDLSDHPESILKKGDQVVWIDDSDPQAGVILEFQDNMDVLLRLDNPIRSLSPPFSLIYTVCVPLCELMKFEDFHGESRAGGQSDLCEKSCQASNENLRNSQLERPQASEPQRIPPRNCYSGATAPPRDLCLDIPPRPPPLVKYLVAEQDSCDFISRDPSLNISPSKISPNLSSSSSNLDDYGEPHSPVDNLDNHLDLGVGSMVEVTVDGVPYHGVIRWTGQVYAAGHTVAGIEMEEEHDKFCDGMMNNKQRFHCNPKRGHFVPLFQCRLDSRFIESHCPGPSASSHMLGTSPDREFGGKECPIIPGAVAPINVERDIENYCGKFCGIQGHHNSCYLDATLFAMFTFTSVFDNLLFRPAPEGSSPQYTTVQQVLREEIVNPLRTNLFVRADKVMRLRRLLNELSSVSGLTTEEKDPEEFLTSLVAQILRAEPFLKLSSGQEAYHYQLFVEKDKNLTFPTVQQLFEQSFLTSDIKLKEVPSCLIIQMPRFGKSYKMYPRILPSQLLDITDVLEDSPRQCAICGKLAEFECRKCFNQCDVGLQSLWYCQTCLDRTHTHEKRTDHESCWRRLELPDYFRYDQECTVPRLFMELFAVVCIETSHYVAFVKGGSGCEAPWCFFDSMADRKGERNGYNIPEMVPCSELPHWLSDEGSRQLNEIPDDRQLPEYAKRLMCDAYMCMYQSTDVMMYR